ncbi:TonB system transport protein ExbD [Helicobacter burdigaliensis]|uniref:TonB system transport protein ExbD n=1 Tax=Helicobacter burdigaliensis TaxID=2315334 RepID=UPI000EF6D32A|nr:TonB system transport protein ExbD [Helicobacter burdigaliensis]
MIKIPKNESLNIVPFIDIMLVLLAIVLSISTFIAQGKIQIELPKASSAQEQKDEKKVQILISKEDRIYLDDREVSLEELREGLSAISPKTLVELRSDKDARFENFIQIIDILKGNSHENFSIATKKQ